MTNLRMILRYHTCPIKKQHKVTAKVNAAVSSKHIEEAFYFIPEGPGVPINLDPLQEKAKVGVGGVRG